MKFKPFPTVFMAIAIVFLCTCAHADLLAPGIAAGFNVGFTDATNVSSGFAPLTITNESLSGFGYAASASLGFLQDSFFGFEVAEDLVGLNTSSGGDTFGGKLLVTSATAHFQFHWSAHYHEIGFGYARGNLLSPSSSVSGANISTTMNGFALVGKDYLVVDKKSGPFLTAHVFFFSPGGDFSPLTTVSLLLGFDF